MLYPATDTVSPRVESRTAYPTDTTPEEWAIIAPFLCSVATTGRPRAWPENDIDNAILYVLRGGIAWALLPRTFPPYQTVYRWFRHWTQKGVWILAMDAIRARLRVALGRQELPTAASIDSQSIKTGPGARDTGYDGGKKVKGRRRHLVVDANGLLLWAVVTPANRSEQTEASSSIPTIADRFPTITRIWADGGFSGEPLRLVADTKNSVLEIVEKLVGQIGFAPLPRRWVIERTFSWLCRCRRLARDYEVTIESATGFLYLAALALMTRQLAKNAVGPWPKKRAEQL